MRIAHIIMAHKNPEQLSRLIKRLAHPNFDFFVHVDDKIDISAYEILTSIPQVALIKKRTELNWGGNSITVGIINSIDEVLSLQKGYDFINLLSAQDYPLVSSNRISNFFEGNLGTNFISYAAKGSVWWNEAKGRYAKYHFTDFTFKGRYFVERMANLVMPKRKFPMNLSLYGGSKGTWWTITNECAAYLCDTFKGNKKLNTFLKYCWGTDEFLIQTLIMNSSFKKSTINNNLRYIDWSENNARPKLLLKEDFERLIASGMLFARKFDTDVDVEILDQLDLEINKD
jgi:hypothetical protein